MVEFSEPGSNVTYWVDGREKKAGIYSTYRTPEGVEVKTGVLLNIDLPSDKPGFVNGVPLTLVDTRRRRDFHGTLSVFNATSPGDIESTVLETLRGYRMDSFGHE